MDLIAAVTQQFLGPARAPHEEMQLFGSRPLSKTSSLLDVSEEGRQEMEEENPLQTQMRNMVLDIYNEGSMKSRQEAQSDDEPVQSDGMREDSLREEGQRETDHDTTRPLIPSSSSLPSTRPQSVSGLSLTTVTFPQTESLPMSSYDVALNASVDMTSLTSVTSNSPPGTPRSRTSTLSASHSSLPESLRELNPHLLASPSADKTLSTAVTRPQETVRSASRRRLSFDMVDCSSDGFKQAEASQSAHVIVSDHSNLPIACSSPTTPLPVKSGAIGETNQPVSSRDQWSSSRTQLFVDRTNLLPFTPPFSSQHRAWHSPSSIQTESVKRKARESALQLQAFREEKARLQGKLKTVQAEYSHVLEEKAGLQSSLAACQAVLEIANQRNESLCMNQTELQRSFNLIEGEKKATQARHQRQASVNHGRLSDLKKQVMSLQEQNKKLTMQSQEYMTSLVSRQQRVDELERKLESSRQLVDVHQSDNAGLSNKLLFQQNKVESLETIRESFEQQIEELRRHQKTVQEEGNRAKTDLMCCRDQLEQSRSECLQLEVRLAGMQEARMMEKRHMVESLERISKDWSDHEKTFERVRSEKRGVDEALVDAQRTAMEEKQRLKQMAEQLGLHLEGTTIHLEEQVKAIQQVQVETSEVRKQLALKEEQYLEAERRYQEGLVTIGEMRTQLEQAGKDMDEMCGKLERLERDRVALHQQRDRDTSSHDDTLAHAHHKHQEMEEVMKSMSDDARRKTEELAQSRQRELAVTSELQLTREREAEVRIGKDRLGNELQVQEARHVRELAAKQEEVSCWSWKLETANQSISQLEGKMEEMKRRVTAREAECQRLEGIAQELEKKVSVVTDELERKHLFYEESQRAVETSHLAIETELACVKEQNRLDVAHHVDREKLVKKQLVEAQSARERLESEMQQQLEELSGRLEQLDIQAGREKDEADRQMAVLQEKLADSEHILAQERDVFRSKLETLEMDISHLREQLQQTQSQSHVAVQRQQQRVEDLQQEISYLQLATTSNELESDRKIEGLTLSLELEKGKLAGMLDTQSALKQHASTLEVALARRDQSLVRLSAQARSALAEHEVEEQQVTGRIGFLETELEEHSEQLERAQADQLQQKLQIEKLQCEVATTTEQLTQTRQNVEKLETEKTDLLKRLETTKCSLERCERHLDVGNKKAGQLAIELESVKSELLLKYQEQRSLIDRVESLTWELEQKSVECEQREESVQRSAARHKQEIQAVQRQLEIVRQSNRELHVKLKQTWAGKHTLEEEVLKSRDEMASFQLESEATAVGEMELRTEADVRRQEATAIQARMEKLETQNDSLRRTASSLLDQCLQARRTPSAKPSLLVDQDSRATPSELDDDETIISGPAR